MSKPAFVRPFALLCAPLCFPACDAADSTAVGGDASAQDTLRQALEPVYVDGAAAYVDVADRECRVVLHDVARPTHQGAVAPSCTPNGPCVYVWNGAVDVDAARFDDVARVEVMYRTGTTQGAWYAVPADEIAAPAAGLRRFAFTLDHFTPSQGMSFTSLNRTAIDLIPYLVLNDGTRVLDHNRVADPLGNYALRDSNAWSVPADGVCEPGAPAATPQFLFAYPNMTPSLLDGPVTAGGKLHVEYDGKRLRLNQACMGSEGPVSATTVVADWRFNGGPVETAPVETYVESYGQACQGHSPPCVRDEVSDVELDVPAEATRLELWFHCQPGFSQGAQANWKYDSAFGANYTLPVVDGAKHVEWAGGWELYNARASRSLALPEPIDWSGFTNMGLSVQARAYAPGVTDRAVPTANGLLGYVESDLNTCEPGGAPTRQPLERAAIHAGPYGADHLFRWGIESQLSRCPSGTYRYRFVFSLDGGRTVTALGDVADTTDALTATTWRTLSSHAAGR